MRSVSPAADALDLLGLTVPAEDGGAGMDAVAAAIVHEELSTSDPGFCLAYLAHAILFVNNVARNASAEQRQRYLPRVISGECGRRHGHDRAGGRHRRPRHAHDGAPRWRPLPA